MKKTKFLALVCALLLLAVMIVAQAVSGVAETAEPATVIEIAQVPDAAPAQNMPWTWPYLASIAGCTAATLLIVQFFKVPLERVWKIPTRLFVYMIALAIMVVATAFTTGITPDNFLLTVMNAFIVSLSAYGSYELTFAKFDK